MSTDAPRGELHTTAEVHDAGGVRERDDMCRVRGITVLTTAAVAPDGSLAGCSEASPAERDTPHAQTWNAHDNTHMIAINDAPGFRPRTRLLEYELGAQAGSNGSISAAASGP